MWYYRKLLKISWIHKEKNEEVLNLVKEKRSLYASMKRRRDRLIGHALRHEGLVKKILEGKGTQKERVSEIRTCKTNYR